MTYTTTRRGFLALTGVSLASVSLAGCSLFGIDRRGQVAAPADSALPVDAGRTLVAYFSVPETDDPDGMTQDEENSTHVVDGVVFVHRRPLSIPPPPSLPLPLPASPIVLPPPSPPPSGSKPTRPHALIAITA